MEKVDVAPLRAQLFAEYRDYPNPDNDPVTEFERRAAGIIADFGVFMVQEHNERDTPDQLLIQGIASIAAIMMQQIIGFAPPEIQPKIIDHAVSTLAHYLSGAGTVSVGAIDITSKDVGDA